MGEEPQAVRANGQAGCRKDGRGLLMGIGPEVGGGMFGIAGGMFRMSWSDGAGVEVQRSTMPDDDDRSE